MRQFAEHGFRGAHVEDIAQAVGAAKGTVFLTQSKEGLFMAYQRPCGRGSMRGGRHAGVLGDAGLRLERTEIATSDPVPNRIAQTLIRHRPGLRQPIDRFGGAKTPTAPLEFVESACNAARWVDDIDPEMVASMLDWLAEKFQDALVSEDLDPGLIHRRPERRGMRIKEFVEILRDGIFAREPEA